METSEVLITSVGLYPQLVTLTLDLLLEQPGRNITNVIVFHTTPDPNTPAPGGEHGKKPADLMRGCLKNLRQEFRNGRYRDDHQCRLDLISLRRSDGTPLRDALTPDETRIFWRVMYRTVRDYKASGYRVHLSVAAGRKPMALYSLITAQALLREDDFVWNLVTEAQAEKGPLHLDGEINGRAFQAELVEIRFIPAHEQVQVIFADEADDPETATLVLINRKARQELESLIDFMEPAEGTRGPDQLTACEAKIACLAARGLANKEIASRLNYSPNHVKGTLSEEIYDKLANKFMLDRSRVSRVVLAYLLRPYLDWLDAGRHPRDQVNLLL